MNDIKLPVTQKIKIINGWLKPARPKGSNPPPKPKPR